VDDYLTESDQWEALKRWLRENGAWMVAGVIIGVGVLFGYRWWEERQTARAYTAHARYSDVLTALSGADKTRAVELADQLRSEYSDTPYADHADLVLARAHVDLGELEEAARRLRQVMDTSDDPELGLIARERLARVQLAQDRPDEALATLSGVDAGSFGPRFEEIRGDALFRKGDTAGALAAYRAALAATEPGVADAGLLQLKINDLGAAEAETASAPAPAEQGR
jgi:predicted negative regulator of RcsB-dependent stress response